MYKYVYIIFVGVMLASSAQAQKGKNIPKPTPAVQEFVVTREMLNERDQRVYDKLINGIEERKKRFEKKGKITPQQQEKLDRMRANINKRFEKYNPNPPQPPDEPDRDSQ